MNWNDIENGLPKGHPAFTIDVLVRIVGLSLTASEYESFEVVKWREKDKTFLKWVRDSNGNIVAKKYNYGTDSGTEFDYPNGYPTITHWVRVKNPTEIIQ